MRELIEHKVNECNEELFVIATDESGIGGANHQYAITFDRKDGIHQHYSIDFQNGPVKEVGTNGVTHEALLAILIDRLRGFQSGKFACRENALALTKLEEAMHWLHRRTRMRLQRNVEGTHEV